VIRAILFSVLFYKLIEQTSDINPATVMLVIASCYMVYFPVMLAWEYYQERREPK